MVVLFCVNPLNVLFSVINNMKLYYRCNTFPLSQYKVLVLCAIYHTDAAALVQANC